MSEPGSIVSLSFSVQKFIYRLAPHKVRFAPRLGAFPCPWSLRVRDTEREVLILLHYPATC